MAVNNLSIEQAYTLIADLHEQATGQKTITPVDLSSFISVAQKTLAVGYEPVLNAISQVIGRTLISVRPYDQKFRGMEETAERWGGIIRKINFADKDAVENPTFELVDGQSVDMYEVNKPAVLETRYVGSDVWSETLTIFRSQLDLAFSSPAELASFMSGLMTHFNNMRTQHKEEIARATLANLIAAKAEANDSSVIHLLTEYNAALGLTGTADELDANSVKLPANYGPFTKWVYARVEQISKLMTERSQLFQKVITGYKIMRHTPVTDQRIYMSADFLAHMQAEVLADTYHDNYLRYADVEAVNYWQAIETPDEVSVTPVSIDSDGAVATGTAQTVSDILGIMFDRDAAGFNVYHDTMDTTPFNPRGEYYNLINNMRVQYQNDLTEKSVLLLLD